MARNLNEKLTDGTGIGGKGFSGGRISVAHDQDVVKTVVTGAKWVKENSARSKDHFRIVSGGLSSGGSIKVPLGKSLDTLGLYRK